ncbi:aminotransferase class I/II-fold pyridoxal phosphate-dependent enzyme [Alkalibacillus haloalkaliphilus]|uniref:aminotransferase class I/II-fold pyridoxal phosphate-dependent enzyme n=1 Tax=Alkalibacillus haloalkaliphilus TaxID=94136 RepID=UPI0002EADC0A|nr:aminotransferase class I/II-fold pyridoxal phosphate-dependent enzyme [Alkalibacillus haloalkaliphilus]
MSQQRAPLYEAIQQHLKQKCYSFHVPGHKSGDIVHNQFRHMKELFRYDLTELPGLDDLHESEGPILEAQHLAAQYFGTKQTFFLVNGTTSGNLAMILASLTADDHVLVQRNCHKSVMHALELVGAKPVFISPEYDSIARRYCHISSGVVKQALTNDRNIKAAILTYPDYFGTTFDLSSVVQVAHSFNVPVLVDEAHGAHFSFDAPFPKSATQCGADLVVQSAHKTLPALTMGSFLHVNSDRIDRSKLEYYLEVVQSSSPSYLIMTSLDLARQYIANYSKEDQVRLVEEIAEFNNQLNKLTNCNVLPVREQMDDPLKTVLTSETIDLNVVYKHLHDYGIDAELVDQNQLLFIHGIKLDEDLRQKQSMALINCIKKVEDNAYHDKMVDSHFDVSKIQRFQYSYRELKLLKTEWVDVHEASGRIAAESITPYPPGIPVILNGEYISQQALNTIEKAEKRKQHIQRSSNNYKNKIKVYQI